MELKFRIGICYFSSIPSSNRTFMELKSCDQCRSSMIVFCSNRTFMELKFTQHTPALYSTLF